MRTAPLRPLRWKQRRLDRVYAGGTLGAMLLLEVLPYLEEAVRDWRAHPRRLQPPPAQR